MQISRRALLALTGAAAASSVVGLPAFAQDKGTIGIAMPTKSSARWIADGDSMVKQFTEAGYATDLQYAEDDIPNQLAQIENMITKGVKALVIAAIDGTTLSNALDNAAAAGIKVIAYDRLIRESGSVDYYATFDNFKVGVQQAESLVAGLKERFADVKPWNVELFGGSPDDNNAFFFYNGAMSVLQPMIDAGDIAIPSGQVGMDVVGTLRWDGAVAQGDYRVEQVAALDERPGLVRLKLQAQRLAGDPAVSRDRHAVISFDPRRRSFSLAPGDGPGLVYRNGQEVVMPVTLAAHDRIEVGGSTLLFVPLVGPRFSWEA